MIQFKSNASTQLGIEIEAQLLDRKTGKLSPQAQKVLSALKHDEHVRFQPELFLSMIEINSQVCPTVHDLRTELKESFADLTAVLKSLGLGISTVGTHPTAKYENRIIFPKQRFMDIIEDKKIIARRLLIFGLHVHLSCKSGDHAILLMNNMLWWLPLLLSLSASSPYWQGQDTGMASARITIFESSPAAGHPYIVENWHHFQQMHQALQKAGAIKSVKDLWWDVRPQPDLGTLEIRLLDGMNTLDEILSLTALIHMLALAINEGPLLKLSAPPDWMYRENKWRAARHGLKAQLIHSPNGDHMPAPMMLDKLLRRLKPHFKKFDYMAEYEFLKELGDGKSGYLRQRKIVNKHSLQRLPHFLMKECENSFK